MVDDPVSMNICAKPDTDSGCRTLAAAVEILEQGERLLQRLTGDDYTHVHRCAFSATIGEHYRHCLDHFSCFLRGVSSGLIDYDARDRDVLVERELESAVRMTKQLKKRLGALDVSVLGRPCRTVCKVSYLDSASPEFTSSYERELAYVIAHAIHHYALVAVICSIAGISLPDGFGIAPSTLAHQSEG